MYQTWKTGKVNKPLYMEENKTEGKTQTLRWPELAKTEYIQRHYMAAACINSCYRSCAHGQSLLCLQLRVDEAEGSIQWKMTL